jgi:hypothetical protein
MKKILPIVVLLLFPWHLARGQVPYLEEVKALGVISGQGMACGSSKHPTFEMLARAIMLTKAPTPQMLNEAAYIYSEEKADTYLSKQMDGYYQCDAIVRRFDNQDIFKINLYADGTLKMPDGQIITPRQPYDASALYKADKQIEIKARAIYEGAPARVPDGTPAPVITSVKPDAPKAVSVSAPATPLSGSGEEYAPAMIKHISRRSN